MTGGTARIVHGGSVSLVILGALLVLAANASGTVPLAIIGGVVVLLGAQTLLWTGMLAKFPRRRASAILASVVSVLLVVILLGIRLYAGPEAWSG